MKRMRGWNEIVTLAAVSLGGAAWAQDDQALIEKAARDVQGKPTAAQREGDELDQAEADAAVGAVLAQAKLDLLQARKASREGRHEAAARQAKRVLAALGGLPKETDSSVFELQAEGILGRAEKAGVDTSKLGTTRVAGQHEEAAASQQGSAQERAWRDIAKGYSGGRSGYVTMTVGLGGGEGVMIDTEAVAAIDGARVQYQGDLQELAQSDELRRLVEAQEARVAPEGEVSYPDNWPETVAKRQKYEGGEIARSQTWRDKDGKEWYAAVYDISALTYEPPDFRSSYSLDPVEDLRDTLDRDALRTRSQIYGGYAEDLAAGIPLLRFFGGLDDYQFRGPKYSADRQKQIVEMIRAMTTPSSEAKVIMLEP